MKEVKNRFYEFDGFKLDARERVLSKNGEIIPLTFKSFDVLLTLVQNSGRLIEKDELMQSVWAETIVEEANLKNCISALRKALGDSPHQSRFIQTLPKLGYKFVASVIALPDDDAEIIVEKHTIAEIVIDESEATPELLNGFEATLNDQGLQPNLVLSKETHPLEKASVKVDVGAQNTSQMIVESATRTRTSISAKKIVTLAVMILLLGVSALGLYTWFNSKAARSSLALEKMKITRLPDLGTRALNISADGKLVVYDTPDAIWVRHLETGTATQVFERNNASIWGMSFSPDNQYLYATLKGQQEVTGALYKIPIRGGALEKVSGSVSSPIIFSPDGTRFIYKRSEPELGRNMLVSAHIDGGDEKVILPPNQLFTINSYDWAPDGKSIAVVLWKIAEDRTRSWQVVEVPVEGGELKPLTPEQKPPIAQACWLKDKSGLILAARDSMMSPKQLWYMAYPGGALERITNDLHDYQSLVITAAGDTIFAAQNNTTHHLFTGEMSNIGNLSKINVDTRIGRDVSWTPDNKLLYGYSEGSKVYLWKMSADGSDRQLINVSDVITGGSKLSNDGRYITYIANQVGHFQVWRMDSDGQNAKQITNVAYDAHLPIFSPDGQWIYYQTWLAVGWTVWKIPVDGGSPIQLTHKDTQSWVISPDGKHLAYQAFDEVRKRDFIAIKSTEGGEPLKFLDFPELEAYEIIYWRKEGLYCLNQAHTEIFLLSLEGSKPKALTNFRTGDNITFALSQDGKHIAIVRASSTYEPVLITNFK